MTSQVRAQAQRYDKMVRLRVEPELVQYADNTLMKIRIVGSRQASWTFSIRLSHVIQRELEMKGVALSFGIPKERWNGSLLYTLWKDQDKTSITLHPEHECAVLNYSSCLVWDTWLTRMIQQYYESGLLNIPDQCYGVDLLLTLEYFGILYQPDQLVFQSYPAYARVKLWSDFFTQRALLADWVVETFGNHDRLLLVTLPLKYREPLCLEGERLAILDGSLPSQKGSLPSYVTVYQYFNAPEGGHSSIVAPTMRKDFCTYLQNLLVHVRVSFEVHLLDAPNNISSAVLILQRAAPKATRSRSDLSAPMDELVGEDLATGKLENLLQDAHYRQRTISFDSQSNSPRQVVDDIYRDLEKDFDKAAEPHSDALEYLSQTQDMTPRSQDPVSYSQEESKFTNDPTFSDDLESEIMRNPAPVMMIHAESADNRSITSAITGPFFIDDDGELRDVYGDDEEIRAQALRHEWIQGSLLNRDITDRIKELLEAEEEESTYANEKGLTESAAEWLTTLWQLSCGAVPEASEQLSKVILQHQTWLRDAFSDPNGERETKVPQRDVIPTSLDSKKMAECKRDDATDVLRANYKRVHMEKERQIADSATAAKLVKSRLEMYQTTLSSRRKPEETAHQIVNLPRDKASLVDTSASTEPSIEAATSEEPSLGTNTTVSHKDQSHVRDDKPTVPSPVVNTIMDNKRKGKRWGIRKLFQRKKEAE
jgi:hypothetical protein